MSANDDKNNVIAISKLSGISILSLDKLTALTDQEPPIIVKPGGGGLTVAGEPIDATGVELRLLRRFDNDFSDPVFEPGPGGTGRFVYRLRNTSQRIRWVFLTVGSTIFFVEVPEDAEFGMGIHYE